MVLYTRARSRVGGLDLVNVVSERVPVGVVLFLVLVVLVGFVSVLSLAARGDLDARRVFFVAVVFACVVVDSDSFPEWHEAGCVCGPVLEPVLPENGRVRCRE